MRKGYGLLLAAVVGASVLFGTGPRSSYPTEPRTVLKKQSSPTPGVEAISSDFASILAARCKSDVVPPCKGCGPYCPAAGLLDLIEDQFGARQGQEMESRWNVPEFESKQIRFVIATLPDPVHTHMSLVFDRSIDAIMKAAQAGGYYFSRASMPWNAGELPLSSDLKVRRAQEIYQQIREEFPGLLIFRSSESGREISRPPLLFVLVVGETPTGGIRKKQVHNALRIIHDIRSGASHHVDEDALLILGTTFSGSLLSLKEILTSDPLAQSMSVVMRSGTATSWPATNEFSEFLKNRRPPDTKDSFALFHESDDFALERFREYIDKNGYEGCDMAVLSEDETAYGADKDSQTSEPTSDQNAATACHVGPAKPKGAKEDKDILHLYFPREISQLRAAYQRDLQTQASADASKQASRPSLPLNLDLSGNDDDSVSPYARYQTPLSQESVLLNIVSNLKKHKTKYIVVRASDSLDTLFLCEFFRTAYPEGRLVTIGADLLFQRALDNSRLRGVLAITTYPLLPGIGDMLEQPLRKGIDPSHIDQVFPDNYSVGVFNALLSLLSTPPRKAAPTSLPNYAEYGWPKLVTPEKSELEWRPSLWLTTLGRDGFWPVALLDHNSSSEAGSLDGPPTNLSSAGTVKPGGQPGPVNPPVAWEILWCCSFALICGFSGLMAFPPNRPRSEALVSFIVSRDSVRNAHLFIFGTLLLAVQALFMYPALVWGTGNKLKFFAPPVAAILLLAVCGARGFYVRASSKFLLAFVAIAGGAFVLMEVASQNAAKDASLGRASFSAYRYIHMASGVSPFLPLLFLLLAGLWVCWYSLGGIFLISGRGPVLPRRARIDPGKTMESTPRLKLELLTREANARLLGALKPFRWEWRVHAPAIFTAAGVLYVLGSDRAVNVLEGRTYERIFGLLLFFCVLKLLILTFRVVVIWNEFHVLLRALENLPLRRSFDLLKGFTWRPLWKLAGTTGMMNFYRLITREMEALRQLKNLDVKDAVLLQRIASVESQADMLADFYRHKQGSEDQTRVRLESGLRNLHKRIADASAAALHYLAERWNEEGFDPNGINIEHNSEKPETQHIPKRTACAERFVCLYFLNYILVILRRIQSLLLSIGGMFVFILLSLNFYPFEPHLSLRTLVLILFFLILAAVGFVYAQMHKDAVLSRITDTRPGELGLDFYLRMGGFVLVPLLSLLAAQFPEMNNFLFSWLEPALQALK